MAAGKSVTVRLSARHLSYLNDVKETLRELYPLVCQRKEPSNSEILQMGIVALFDSLIREKAKCVLEEQPKKKRNGA